MAYISKKDRYEFRGFKRQQMSRKKHPLHNKRTPIQKSRSSRRKNKKTDSTTTKNDDGDGDGGGEKKSKLLITTNNFEPSRLSDLLANSISRLITPIVERQINKLKQANENRY